MSYSGTLESGLSTLSDKAYNMNRTLSSETYGGNWADDVGRSYCSYTENLMRTVENLRGTIDGIRRIENNLEAINVSADKSQLSNLKSAVNRL